ncbi:unnamed protein product [Symbiodinium sp. KB8]|nr:unnamed protein product [Symbiodinium sp. KB8]
MRNDRAMEKRLQPIQKSDDEEEVLPRQKSKEFDKGEKNEKNPPKSKKGRRDGQKLDMKKLLTEGTQAEPAKSVTQESEASSFAAQPAQPVAAVPAPGAADYNEAVQNLMNALGSKITKEQVEYSLSRYVEQGMDLTQAADCAFMDLAEGQPSGSQEGQHNHTEADAAVDEGSEEEDEQLPELDLPELIPQERRPPIPATPKGWKAGTLHSASLFEVSAAAMTERDPYGLKPGKQGRAGGHSHGKGKLAQPPRPINFRRRWDHGKDLDDPVYPTMKIPAALMPLFPQDWRSAGRALLCLGMAMLEGIRLRSKGATLKWQKAGYCSALCQEQCAKSPNRIFCAWRVQNTVHDHHNRLDGALLSYKGVVHYDDPKKPIYRILNQVALKNRYKSERMVWDTSQAAYIFADREEIHPGFGIRPDRDESHYAPDEETYDSDSDLEASSADEDSDGDGMA